MCGCNSGGMATQNAGYYTPRFSNVGPGVSYKWVVNHPGDPADYEFSTDVEAYADIAAHPGSGVKQVKVVP